MNRPSASAREDTACRYYALHQPSPAASRAAHPHSALPSRAHIFASTVRQASRACCESICEPSKWLCCAACAAARPALRFVPGRPGGGSMAPRLRVPRPPSSACSGSSEPAAGRRLSGCSNRGQRLFRHPTAGFLLPAKSTSLATADGHCLQCVGCRCGSLVFFSELLHDHGPIDHLNATHGWSDRSSTGL